MATINPSEFPAQLLSFPESNEYPFIDRAVNLSDAFKAVLASHSFWMFFKAVLAAKALVRLVYLLNEMNPNCAKIAVIIKITISSISENPFSFELKIALFL